MTKNSPNPQIEFLEKLLSEARNHSLPIEKFFDEYWRVSSSLPRSERRNVVEKANEFIKGGIPLQPKNVALGYLAMAVVSFNESNYEEALREGIRAQKIYIELHDEDGMQAANAFLGSVYRTLGELELALKSLLEAYHHLSRTLAHKGILRIGIYNLAEIYLETGQYDEALGYYKMIEQLSEGEEYNTLQPRSMIGIAAIYRHRKSYALALDYYMQSLHLAEQMKSLPTKAVALTELGVYFYETGDYVKASEYQKQALNIRRDLNIPNGVVTNLIHLAEISVKQNHPDKSIKFLKDAMKTAEEIKVKAKLYQIHEKLSVIYESKGEPIPGMFHFKAFYRIREEVQHEDNQKRIKNFQLIFEAEQTKKENEIIKRQKQEIERKNIELQETIEELTLAKIGRKARAITLIIAILLFIIQDNILYFALNLVSTNNYFISLLVKMVIIFSLSPINKAVEHYLLRKVIKKKKKEVLF